MTAGKRKRHAGEAGVAVVVSQFGTDLSRLFDMNALVRGIKANKSVDLVRVQAFPSSRREVDEISASIRECGISRVVVAGSSERLFGKLYREALERSGISSPVVEFADIAELAGPGPNRKAAAAGAVALVDLAVARAAVAVAVETIETEIKPICVVVGGGVAGISAATALAARGIKVVLVEKEAKVGGLLRRLNVVFPAYRPASEFLTDQVKNLEEAGVEVVTGVEPVGVKGHVGDFRIELSDGRTLEAGAIVVATGADLLKPAGIFGYGERDEVVTQIELERMLLDGSDPGSDIVMIQCAGSRNEERPYCSRICCTASIKNTILIKQRFPAARITVLSRGFAEYAGDLDRAREMGVEIIRYSPERPPAVGDGVVEVYDEISEMESHIPFDRVVLAVPMVPSASSRALAGMLRTPTDQYGFLVEPHLKIRPEEHAPRGIFVAGAAHWPSTVTEAIVQGYGAASRAFDLLSMGRIVRRAVVTEMIEGLCRGCGRCEEVCRHGAIEIVEDEDGMKRAGVIPIQCTGCGVCVSVCPSGALMLSDMSSDQMNRTVEALKGA